MKLVRAIMVGCLLSVPAAQSHAEVDEAAIVGRVIVASSLCPEFALDEAVEGFVEAKVSAGEADFRTRVADTVEKVFPLLSQTKGTDDFTTYCETMRRIAARSGLGG